MTRPFQKLSTLAVFVFDCHQIIEVNLLLFDVVATPVHLYSIFAFTRRIRPSSDHSMLHSTCAIIKLSIDGSLFSLQHRTV